MYKHPIDGSQNHSLSCYIMYTVRWSNYQHVQRPSKGNPFIFSLFICFLKKIHFRNYSINLCNYENVVMNLSLSSTFLFSDFDWKVTGILSQFRSNS